MIIESQQRSGASWFFGIAGLSLVNSIVFFFGGEWPFIIGLGITQLFDGIGFELVQEVGPGAQVFCLILDVVVIAVFILFGILSRRRHTWAFIVGIVFYALDALILVLVSDSVGILFHGLALFYIFRGLKANKKLKAMQEDFITPFSADTPIQ